MSASKARELLGILLDRVERRPGRTHAPSERAPAAFASADDREAFNAVIADAERGGAVAAVMGRGEASHIVERIKLKDAALLYRFLGRVPESEHAREAAGRLRNECVARSPEGAYALDTIAAGWLRGERPFNLGRDRVAQAREFVVALDAALARNTMDRRDLRTYSGQVTGDSKLMERQASRIVAFLKQSGRLDPTLTDGDAMAELGLEKFPQPLLIAGSIRVAGAALSGFVYAGIAPEHASLVEPFGPIRSVLTVENLASFNRHVREARQPGDIVVFTGGWPSRAVSAALMAISKWPDVSCIYHWGDIDESGLKIALSLEDMLKIPVLPHLMSTELACRYGVPAKPARSFNLSSGNLWHSLAQLLESRDARFLEQELIDPAPVSVKETELNLVAGDGFEPATSRL